MTRAPIIPALWLLFCAAVASPFLAALLSGAAQ
jgi:hypothetical protein